MTLGVFQLIEADKADSLFLSQASDHIRQRRFHLAEPLLVGALRVPIVESRPETRFDAHCYVLLATAQEARGVGRHVEPLYHRAVTIYDRELGFEHPAVRELAFYLYQHFYF